MKKRLMTFFIVLCLLTTTLTVGLLARASANTTITIPATDKSLASTPGSACVELCGSGNF